ncbi:RHS repeat-associated core domain-containing protein [Blastopirellula marina]|uniref:Teneurin-like YD-shell domain-containing protein n=1 Tax=Blastopirellula marina TaxID=124 RepID=A0A2S8GGB9_9BACT|nr:RHS repeat-associated core domain-containing protein [Blastopirellula marina]PQO43512.1 hypothetical protein C5Y93_22935 [Blastopirellula marina]
MRIPVSMWCKTLSKLGLKAKENRKRRVRAWHNMQIEQLDRRDLMAVDAQVTLGGDIVAYGSTFAVSFDDIQSDTNGNYITGQLADIVGDPDPVLLGVSSKLNGSSTNAFYDSSSSSWTSGVQSFGTGGASLDFKLYVDGLVGGGTITLDFALGSVPPYQDYGSVTLTLPEISPVVTTSEEQETGTFTDETALVPVMGDVLCSCANGSFEDVRAVLLQPGNAVLTLRVNIDSSIQIDDTLLFSGTFGGQSVSASYDLSTARTEDVIEIPFELEKSLFGGDLLADYSITMSSSGGWLDVASATYTGDVSLGADTFEISSIPTGEVVTGGIEISMGDGKTVFYASDGLGGFDSPAGEFSTLVAITGGYRLTSRWGHVYTFDLVGTTLYLASRVQADGRESTYSYTTIGSDKLLTSIVGDTDTVTLAYTSGQLTSVSDTKGNSLAMTYTAGGQIETITRADPDGAGPLAAPTKTYTYNGSSQVSSVNGFDGLDSSYTYDSTGRIATATATNGEVTTMTSAAEAVLTSGESFASYTDSNGVTVQTQYDALGNVIREIDGEGNETVYERDANGLATKITYADPDGAGPLEAAVYEYTYDSRGNKLTETLPDLSVRTWVYHSTWNRPVQYTDANGNVTLYEYDSTYELLLSKTTVIGEIDDLVNLETDDLTTSYTYTPAPTLSTDPPIGLMASMTAPDGVVTEYEYDEDGNRTQTTYAVGTSDEASTSVTYDSAGNMLTETDELGNTTTYTYDNLQRRTSITTADPDGAGPLSASVTSYAYNVMGLVAIETLNGRTTSYTYDSKGRVSSVLEEDPDDTGPLTAPVTSYTYDTHGNVLTVTDPLGNVTTNTYTGGLLTSVTGEDPDDAGPLAAPVTSYTYDDNGKVLTITDPLGRVTTYAYDGLGRQISVTYPDPDGAGSLDALSETTVYDLFGRVSSKTDTSGVTTTYTYDHEGNLLTETTPLGTTTYTYDELNRRVEVETADPDGAGALTALTTVYVYSAAGTLVSVTTPVGTTTYGYDYRRRRTSVTQADPDGAGPLTAPVSYTTYDDAGNVLTETDALGNVTSYEYDALNRVIEITAPDPDGAGALTSPVTSYGYDVFGQLVNMTDPNGGVTTYEYDDLGRKITEVSPDPDGAGALTSPEVSYAYDAAGQLVSMTDQLGNVTTYEYDNLGRKISITLPDPDGAGAATSPETTYVYDAAGQLTSMTDPLGRTTSYTYDAMGRTLTETFPDPDGAGALTAPVTTYTYDDDGRRESVEDAASQTVSYTYNSAGQIATMTDPTGVTTYTYDALGRQLTVTEPDPDGAGPLSAPVTTYVYNDKGQLASMSTLEGTTSYEYDNLGRTVKVTMPDPDGAGSLLAAWTIYEYDALGRTLSETNRLGNETSYDYDNLGRLIKKTDAEGGETEYTYDANGNRLTLTDPEENTTTWTYDYLNRMLTNTNELSDTRTYEYDAAGNLVEYTDRNDRVIEYEYDNLQRRTAEYWMDGATTVHTISYSYDAASQLIEASDSAATYTFTYDSLGRNTSTEHDLAALGFDVVIDEAYDALGRRVSLTAEIDGTDDLENTYAYDYLNRMTQVTQAGQAGGNAVAEKRVDFTYDAEDKYQFTSITRYADLAGTETVATSTYGYDYADQLTSITHVDGGSSTLAGYTYSYDEGNRLTGFTVYGYSAEDATYSYDDTDQLTGADRSGTTSDESYTYDENGNRTGGGYSTGDNNQVLSDGTYNYTYDDEGNRLTKTNISTGDYEFYAWDYRNRLASVTAYDASSVKLWKVDYGYDAFDNLISREVDSNGNGTVDASSYFVYDGNQILLVVDDAGDVEHRMLWGPQVDQLLADENGAGDVLWALTDQQNTVRDYVQYDDLLDATTAVNHIAYDASGQVASETSGTLDAFRFRYTGKYVDTLTELQYNVNRWYDPTTARWMSQDPIGFEAGDANLYRYVGNSFINMTDPSGLQELKAGENRKYLSATASFNAAWDFSRYDHQLRYRHGEEIGSVDRLSQVYRKDLGKFAAEFYGASTKEDGKWQFDAEPKFRFTNGLSDTLWGLTAEFYQYEPIVSKIKDTANGCDQVITGTIIVELAVKPATRNFGYAPEFSIRIRVNENVQANFGKVYLDPLNLKLGGGNPFAIQKVAMDVDLYASGKSKIRGPFLLLDPSPQMSKPIYRGVTYPRSEEVTLIRHYDSYGYKIDIK